MCRFCLFLTRNILSKDFSCLSPAESFVRALFLPGVFFVQALSFLSSSILCADFVFLTRSTHSKGFACFFPVVRRCIGFVYFFPATSFVQTFTIYFLQFPLYRLCLFLFRSILFADFPAASFAKLCLFLSRSIICTGFVSLPLASFVQTLFIFKGLCFSPAAFFVRLCLFLV